MKEKEFPNVQDVVNWQRNTTGESQAGFKKEKKKSSPKLTRFREEKEEDPEEEIDLRISALEEELLGLELEEKVAKQKKVELLQAQNSSQKSEDFKGERTTKPWPNNLQPNTSIRGTINHQRAKRSHYRRDRDTPGWDLTTTAPALRWNQDAGSRSRPTTSDTSS